MRKSVWRNPQSIKDNNDLKSEVGYYELNSNDAVSMLGIRKIPCNDWAQSFFFQKVLKGQTKFNPEEDPSFFREEEIDYILTMIKEQYRDFRENDLTRPFFIKGIQTLKRLLADLGLEGLFGKLCKKYDEVSIENTFKIMIRIRMLFSCWHDLESLLTNITRHEILM